MPFVADPPKGRFVPDKPAAPPAPPEPQSDNPFVRSGQSELSDVGDASDAAITSMLNIGHRAWEGLKDVVSSITGHGDVERTPGPAKLSSSTAADLQPGPIAKAAIEPIAKGASAADAALGNFSPTAQDVVHETGRKIGDALDIASAVAPVSTAAGALADTLGGAAARSAATAVIGTPEATMDHALTAVGFRNLPRQGGRSGLEGTGAKIVGEQPLAQQNTLNNQAVADTLAKHEAGVPQEQDLDYANTARARINGPGKIYNAAEAAMPDTMVHDPELQTAIANVSDTTSQLPRSPDVEGLKQTMLNQPNMTRTELFKNIQVARERAARFHASDAPGAQDIGDAYKGIADAYEDFVGRQLAANPSAGVSLEDWQNARTAFAKNYAVQAAIKGTSVDASKIAALQRKDPDRLTGGLQLIAEQHNRYPLSTGFGPNTFDPGGVGASGTPQGIVARHVTGPLLGAGIGSLVGGPAGTYLGGATGLLASEGAQSILRKALGGSAEAGRSVAARALEDPQLRSLFETLEKPEPPTPPLDLTPPPGRAFEPHQPNLATGQPSRSFFGTGADAVPGAGPMGAPGATAEHPGQIPLFDVLSHGVEQPPAPGLSAGPMGTPPGRGVPFTRNAGHEAGGLSLTDELEQAAHENNSDLAGVKSARIPDRTIGAERTLPKESPTPGSGSVDLPTRPGLSDDELSLQHEPTLEELLEDLRDHPAVMSQGVPEDTMQRTPRVNRGGSDTGSIKAASPEAMNRGTRNVLQIDPDARATPVLKDVTQIDAKAPPGHLLIDGDTHEILDRGGLPLGHAKGLLNRYIAIHARPPLMEEFE